MNAARTLAQQESRFDKCIEALRRELLFFRDYPGGRLTREEVTYSEDDIKEEMRERQTQRLWQRLNHAIENRYTREVYAESIPRMPDQPQETDAFLHPALIDLREFRDHGFVQRFSAYAADKLHSHINRVEVSRVPYWIYPRVGPSNNRPLEEVRKSVLVPGVRGLTLLEGLLLRCFYPALENTLILLLGDTEVALEGQRITPLPDGAVSFYFYYPTVKVADQ